MQHQQQIRAVRAWTKHVEGSSAHHHTRCAGSPADDSRCACVLTNPTCTASVSALCFLSDVGPPAPAALTSADGLNPSAICCAAASIVAFLAVAGVGGLCWGAGTLGSCAGAGGAGTGVLLLLASAQAAACRLLPPVIHHTQRDDGGWQPAQRRDMRVCWHPAKLLCRMLTLLASCPLPHTNHAAPPHLGRS